MIAAMFGNPAVVIQTVVNTFLPRDIALKPSGISSKQAYGVAADISVGSNRYWHG